MDIEEKVNGSLSAAVWRERFEEIYGLPHSFVAEKLQTAPKEIIKILKSRGDLSISDEYATKRDEVVL